MAKLCHSVGYFFFLFLYKQEAVEAFTHHLQSEALAGNRRMATAFAKLRLIVFLRCIGLDWMPL